ncbi:MAG TPA: hypothetical protein VJ647_00705, partial [Chitinophagaceae bacterium]|nr:hypothetical protein [Chitinophagaceae bacterium]
LGFAQSGFMYNAEIANEGVVMSNFSRSSVTPCGGSWNWRTTQFRSGVTNEWRSPHINLGSSTAAITSASVDFKYKVVAPVGTGTWTIRVDLYTSGTLKAALGTVTGSGSTAGSGCLMGNKFGFFGTPLTGPFEIRFTVTTTNSSISASNYVQIDEVFGYFVLLASPKPATNGLTQPSYTTGTRNIYTSGSDKYGDVYVTKSAQSGVSNCTGSDPFGPDPICKTTSVNCIHEVKIIDKTTGAVSYGTLQAFTIPYQAATHEQAYTNVQFESATSYYVHYFTVPTVEPSGNALYWRTYEVAQP